jgi:hypothetical protein
MTFWDFFFILLVFPLTIAWVYTVVDIFMRPDVGALGKFRWLFRRPVPPATRDAHLLHRPT